MGQGECDVSDRESECGQHAWTGQSWWQAVLVHAVVAVVIVIGLFCTVHNRDWHHEAFDRDLVATHVFQDRWNDLSDFWSENGWWAHGGLWYLNVDRNFNRWLEGGGVDHWGLGEDPDPNQDYYYRSNSVISLLPLHVARQAGHAVTGESPGRSLLITHNLILVTLVALLLGLTATRLFANVRSSVLHAVLIGSGVQCVLQTHPLLLMSFFRLYFEHVFLLGASGVLLAAVLPATRWTVATRAVGVLIMVVSDLPLAIPTIAAWALLNLIAGKERFRRERWWVGVVFPAVVGVVIIAAQYIVLTVAQPDAVVVGSNLLFRTGFDGDSSRYSTLWEGVLRFATRGEFFGPLGARPGGTPWFWVIGIAACVVTVTSGAYSRRMEGAARVVALGATLFFPFLLIFSNAAFIHPFAYPMLLLPALAIATFAGVPALCSLKAQRLWPIVTVTLVVAASVSIANLRRYLVAFPIDTTSLLIPILTVDSDRDASQVSP